MGVDAMMFVKLKGSLSPDRVRELASDLSAAFWRDPFMIDRPGSKWTPEGRHALEIVEYDPDDVRWVEVKKGEQLIRVELSGRYYGENYERGNWPVLSGIARWLKARIPGGKVYYGGDTDGDLDELTDKRDGELWDHFIRVGHSPYVESDGWSTGRVPRPTCDFCNRLMWNQSSGPYNRQGFTCEGCGYRNETNDGGKTFQPVEEKT